MKINKGPQLNRPLGIAYIDVEFIPESKEEHEMLMQKVEAYIIQASPGVVFQADPLPASKFSYRIKFKNPEGLEY